MFSIHQWKQCRFFFCEMFTLNICGVFCMPISLSFVSGIFFYMNVYACLCVYIFLFMHMCVCVFK